ncbi:MAG: hypothetical protein R2724_19315 [Bryobacterales bacterium]
MFAQAAPRNPPKKTYVSTMPQMTRPDNHGGTPPFVAEKASGNAPRVSAIVTACAPSRPVNKYGMVSPIKNGNSASPMLSLSKRSRKYWICVM